MSSGPGPVRAHLLRTTTPLRDGPGGRARRGVDGVAVVSWTAVVSRRASGHTGGEELLWLIDRSPTVHLVSLWSLLLL